MSYEQHMKHSRNHNKNRYYQQCGFSLSGKEESYAAVAERTAESYHVRDMRTGEVLSPNFDDTDDAVLFIRSLPDRWCGVFTDKGMCLMK